MWSALGSGPLNEAAQWQGEPNGRGTWQILSTCLLTLILCLWTAVHMNVPQEGQADAQFWRKAKWLLMALVAPEIVVYTAFQQRLAASHLHTRMVSLLDPITEERRGSKARFANLIGAKKASGAESEAPSDEPADPAKRRKHLWSRDHSALAVMGGFAFDAGPGPSEAPFPGNRTRLVLTPHGLQFLAKHHPELIPDISSAGVKDRSKADGLTKTLACVQALYFLCQTIARLAVGFPVTVFELNTVAHAICALTTYILWWYKPFDVKEPLLISARTPLAVSLCAAMCMRSGVGYWKETQFSHHHSALLEFDFDLQTPDESEQSNATESIRTVNAENEQLRLTPQSNEHAPPALPPRQTDESLERIDPEAAVETHALGSASKPEGANGSFVLTPFYPEHGLVVRYYTSRIFTRKSIVTLFGLAEPEGDTPDDPSVTITTSILQCCNTARKVIRDYPELAEPLVKVTRGEPFKVEGDGLDFLCDKIDDFPRVAVTVTRFRGFILSLCGAALANVVYSAVHLLAWNGPFRTKAETILWRMSAATLAAPSVSLVPCFLMGGLTFWAIPMRSGMEDTVIYALFRSDRDSFVDERFEADGSPLKKFVDLLDKRPDNATSWLKLAPSILLALLWGIAFFVLLVVMFPLSLASIYSYFVGRWYVVVESLLSLPYSPAGVYETPDWNSYFPHLH